MPTPRTTTEILEYHRRAVVALRTLDRAFESSSDADRAYFPRTKEAFRAVLEDMRDELDDEVVLALVASTERLLRLDFAARLGNSGAPATRFGALNARFEGRVPLEEILDVWKELTGASDEAGPKARLPARSPLCEVTLRTVVRRDETDREPQPWGQGPVSRCISPTGASPVRVSAGAPGSRPQVRGEVLAARAGRREPLRREQERGPQHEVKPAASSEKQWGSRAAHVTAKATSDALRSGSARASGPSGVGGAARVQGEVRNTRGPSALPSSRQGGSYKPKVKASAAQRESEGIVVPSIAATKNAVGGKGPCDGRVGGGGKREGMAGKSGPNHPRGRRLVDKVRQLQRRLWIAAKRHAGRRFHALYDRIARRDVLAEAWKRVKRNRGAAGVDAQTIADVEQYGVERFLEELGAELQAGTYRPAAVLRRYIPKADGTKRPLGIPTVRDRVAQMAAKLVLEPIFEADFLPSSYGFRPRRSATQALETLRKLGARGGNHVLDADIRDYFGSIDHEKLMVLVERRISDRRVLKLLRQWLQAGVMEDGVESRMLSGSPQGGVISPLLSNIYLHVLDTAWELIRDLNPVLRGWGNYFRTGNAAGKFNQVDDYVRERLRGFLVKRKGRNLRAGETKGWTSDFFVQGHGLHRLRGTVQYPEAV